MHNSAATRQKQAFAPQVKITLTRTPALRVSVSQSSGGEFGEVCRLLGLCSARDTSHTIVRVFRFVVSHQGDARDEGKGIKSAQVAQEERLNRLTAMHHLNRLVEAGLLEKRGPKYFMRTKSFEEMVEEMQREAEESFARARLIMRRLRQSEF